MPNPSYTLTRTLIGRLRHGEDLLAEITRVANEENIVTGTITGIGKLNRATVAILNHTTSQYENIEFDESLEITSIIGNISRFKGRAFPHVHLTLSNRQGSVYGGHLVQGCEIWVVEVVIQEFSGGTLSRDFDPETGLPMWNKESIL